jgi:hypothetical protein
MTSLTLYHHADGRIERLETDQQRPFRWLAWKPGSDEGLIVGNRGDLFGIRGQKLTPIPTGTTHNLRGAGWSADGATALLVGNRGAVLVLERGAVRAIETPTTENLRRLAWHPHEPWALIVGNAGTVLRFEREDGHNHRLWPVPADRAHTLRAVAFRPDGAYALVGAYASRWGGYPRPHALYRCDGRYLQAVLATDEEDDLVAVDWRAETGEALIAGYAWQPEQASAPARNKLITFDGSVYVCRVVESAGYLWGAAWRPQGDYALLTGQRGLILRFDGDRIAPVANPDRSNLVGPFWKPDGTVAIMLKGPDENVYTV